VTLSLYETIQRIVAAELLRVRTADLAVVQELHPHAGGSDKDNYACTVQLRNSQIVLKRVPVATQQIGAVSIPNVGDLVLVQFIGGDVNAPVITGRLYNDEDRPPPNDEGQAIVHLPLGAGDGDAVHLELNSGDSRALTLQLGDGLKVELKDDDPAVKIDVGGGKATVQIDRDGTIKLENQGKVQISGSEIKIEAQAQLTLKGATVAIN
jgi:uncharacterized protein involved in type VI secretion and phage assembly